jgi:hypothetical protein
VALLENPSSLHIFIAAHKDISVTLNKFCQSFSLVNLSIASTYINLLLIAITGILKYFICPPDFCRPTSARANKDEYSAYIQQEPAPTSNPLAW